MASHIQKCGPRPVAQNYTCYVPMKNLVKCVIKWNETHKMLLFGQRKKPCSPFFSHQVSLLRRNMSEKRQNHSVLNPSPAAKNTHVESSSRELSNRRAGDMMDFNLAFDFLRWCSMECI